MLARQTHTAVRFADISPDVILLFVWVDMLPYSLVKSSRYLLAAFQVLLLLGMLAWRDQLPLGDLRELLAAECSRPAWLLFI